MLRISGNSTKTASHLMSTIRLGLVIIWKWVAKALEVPWKLMQLGFKASVFLWQSSQDQSGHEDWFVSPMWPTLLIRQTVFSSIHFHNRKARIINRDFWFLSVTPNSLLWHSFPDSRWMPMAFHQCEISCEQPNYDGARISCHILHTRMAFHQCEILCEKPSHNYSKMFYYIWHTRMDFHQCEISCE